MSAELITTVAAVAALGFYIHREIASLRERMARLEGVVDGLRSAPIAGLGIRRRSVDSGVLDGQPTVAQAWSRVGERFSSHRHAD